VIKNEYLEDVGKVETETEIDTRVENKLAELHYYPGYFRFWLFGLT